MSRSKYRSLGSAVDAREEDSVAGKLSELPILAHGSLTYFSGSTKSENTTCSIS